MKKSIGIVMDPIESISPKKDSTLAMMLAAQKKGWDIFYMQPKDIFFEKESVLANMSTITVYDDNQKWFDKQAPSIKKLSDLDLIIMRKDPPFDMEYIYCTYLLEHAETQGTRVINKPQSLRDANEKFFTTYFPDCIPNTIISRDRKKIKEFLHEEQHVVIKPLDGMGGSSIFHLKEGDKNINVILETMLANEEHTAMVQTFLPEYVKGDKRILIINGEPINYALARVPPEGESRANLAAGGHGIGVELTDRDKWLCSRVGPELKKRGLWFVGLDVIGDYITEINVTSPTCIRELDRIYDLDIGMELMNSVEKAFF